MTKWVCLQGNAGATIQNLRFEINIIECCYLPNLSPPLFQKHNYYNIPTAHNTKSCISLKCQCFCYLCCRIGLCKSCHRRNWTKKLGESSTDSYDWVGESHLEVSKMPDFKVKAREQLCTIYSASKETINK